MLKETEGTVFCQMHEFLVSHLLSVTLTIRQVAYTSDRQASKLIWICTCKHVLKPMVCSVQYKCINIHIKTYACILEKIISSKYDGKKGKKI